jgi:hypothetical protein
MRSWTKSSPVQYSRVQSHTSVVEQSWVRFSPVESSPTQAWLNKVESSSVQSHNSCQVKSVDATYFIFVSRTPVIGCDGCCCAFGYERRKRNSFICRSQRPRDLRLGSAADRLLVLGVRISTGTWVFVLCVVSTEKGTPKKNQDKERSKEQVHTERTRGVQKKKLSVLWGRGLCDGLIPSPEQSYRLWWVIVCDLESSQMT